MNCVQRSITEKWEPILRGERANGKGDDCPCCMLHNSCHTCPIQQYSGEHQCWTTPYWTFFKLLKNRSHSVARYPYDIHAELTACAQWEIDFLHEVLEASGD